MPLNLIQVQERLKGLPTQVVMEYANGANAEVPPYIALGELNRRRQMQESEQARIAKETAGAPSIKEQIEQTAGVLALQANRQQQAAQEQQGVMAMTPMAAPNTVTSEPAQLAEGGYLAGGEVDPELEAMMMGMGGVGTLPTNDIFVGADYAGGGVVAFQEGGFTDPVGLAPWELATEEDLKRYPGLRAEVEREVDTLKKLISGGGKFDYYSKPTSEEDDEGMPVKRAKSTSAKEEKYPDEFERGPKKDIARDPSATRDKIVGKPGITSILPGEVGGVPTGGGAVATPRTNKDIEFLRSMYAAEPEDYAAKLRAAGLAERPQTGRELEELRRQLGEYSKSSDSFVNRLLAIEPGRKGIGGGTIGKSVAKYETERTNRINQLRTGIAKAEDLDARADYEFRRGNFDAGERLKTEANKERAINANRAGELGVRLEQIAAQREGTAAQAAATAEARRSTNLAQIENARTRALAQSTRAIDEQINAIAGLAALGQPLSPPQKAQLEALKKERDAIIASINAKFDQMATQQGGGSGGFKVIGVKPGQ